MPIQSNIEHVKFLSKPDTDTRLDGWHEIVCADHFWVRKRQDLIIKHFGEILRRMERIADVGCGRGITILELNRILGKSLDGFELNQKALLQCPPIPGTLHIYDFFDFEPSLKGVYDGFLLLDVLEHVEDDAKFLKALSWHLKPGGKVLINVPSNQMLYSRYDEAAGHYRRYDVANLTQSLERAGFKAAQHVNWGYVYLPLLVVRKWLSKNVPEEQVIRNGFDTSPLMNALLGAWSRLDLQTSWRKPGTSLLMLAEKVR